MKRKVITIREDEAKWVEEKCINLSRFVQKKIREEMKEDESKKGNTAQA